MAYELDCLDEDEQLVEEGADGLVLLDLVHEVEEAILDPVLKLLPRGLF